MSTHGENSNLLGNVSTAKNEIVVLCGVPGSGKSTIAKTRFANYVRINLDTVKTRNKERLAILQAINNGDSIVVDSTNTTRKARTRYVEIARAHRIPTRCIFLECPVEIALRRNANRRGKEKVPDFVLRFYFKRIELPSKSEGFDSVEIVRILDNK
jgi:predicted kinase